MKNVKRKLSKEEYDELIKLDTAALYKKVQANIPIEWACGYGWYGCELKEIDSEYYIVHTIGDSCD